MLFKRHDDEYAETHKIPGDGLDAAQIAFIIKVFLGFIIIIAAFLIT